jgi:hypothetical protein
VKLKEALRVERMSTVPLFAVGIGVELPGVSFSTRFTLKWVGLVGAETARTEMTATSPDREAVERVTDGLWGPPPSVSLGAMNKAESATIVAMTIPATARVTRLLFLD